MDLPCPDTPVSMVNSEALTRNLSSVFTQPKDFPELISSLKYFITSSVNKSVDFTLNSA